MTVGLRPNNAEGIASEIACQLIYELFLGVAVSALIDVSIGWPLRGCERA